MIETHPSISFDMKQIESSKSITEFDDAVTRRVFGFRTVHEYYRKGSSAQYVPDIEIPGLLFSALDDPIAHHEAIPVYEVWGNPNIVLATTAKGGHIGWFTGFFRPQRWFAKPVGDFFHALFEVSFLSFYLFFFFCDCGVNSSCVIVHHNIILTDSIN
jgi:predicted alpha/beta-fold hydrolase